MANAVVTRAPVCHLARDFFGVFTIIKESTGSATVMEDGSSTGLMAINVLCSVSVFTTELNALANSIGFWKRSSLFLASALFKTLCTWGERPGMGGGGSVICFSRMLIVVSPSNGTLPASISYNTMPSE